MSSGFLLDTKEWLAVNTLDTLYVSVITIAEIRLGIELLPAGKRRTQLEAWFDGDLQIWFRGRILPVDTSVVRIWASLIVQRQSKGRPLANFDGLLAATASHHDLTLVTRNVRDFGGLGIRTLDPWAPAEPAQDPETEARR